MQENTSSFTIFFNFYFKQAYDGVISDAGSLQGRSCPIQYKS
uniref:Uncharacterized protein n=1 Tax=Nelumbo nucifera TaxID=4432 RepID=A0A822YV54_NELNU|nr:TPA_asm: hypothetical protein HUJ06_007193 [Nelumbo nucifera]